MTQAVEWEELTPLVPEACELASILSAADFEAVNALQPGPAVLLRAEALRAVVAHAANSAGEVMGLLRGRALQNAADGRMLTLVLESQALLAAHGSGTRVHASAASWQAAWPHMQDHLPVIGWYHSHPGFGIFFSRTDRESQRNYLSQPWQVGLVVDPVSGEAGAFLGRECARVPLVVGCG